LLSVSDFSANTGTVSAGVAAAVAAGLGLTPGAGEAGAIDWSCGVGVGETATGTRGGA
jgi:hypothetical protein